MNGYARRTQQKKEAIINAAQELFFERGVTGATINEIARKAGVSPVSIYNYFGGKKELLRVVMERYMNRAIDDAEAILEKRIPFEQKIRAIFALELENYSQAFLKSIAWEDPALQELYREFAEKRALPFFRKYVEQGKEAGVIHRDITWEAFMAYQTALMPLLTQPDFLKSSDKYKRALNRLFYFGLIGK